MKNQSLKYIIYIIGLLILILGPLYAFTKDDVLSSYDLSNHKFNYSRPCKQLYWKYEEMIAIRNNLGEKPYKVAYEKLLSTADLYLKQPNLSIVDDKEHIPVSGDIHDYMSIARYTWPDTIKADGLPYITRDCYTNPEYYTYDREVMLKMIERVKIFTLAWFYGGDAKYANAALKQLKVWFIDDDSYMKPSMEYGQIHKGLHNDHGTQGGVLEAEAFVDLIDPLCLLEKYKNLESQRCIKKIKQWYRQLLEWELSSNQGLSLSKAPDNCGTAYDLQILSFSSYCGDRKLAQAVIDKFAEKRINKQINDSGVQIEEVKRAISYGYSVANITVMTNFIVIAHNLKYSVDKSALSKYYKAIDYLTPYLDENAEWPYYDITSMPYYRKRLCFELFWVAKVIDASRLDYIEIYEKYGKLSDNDVNNLLYITGK